MWADKTIPPSESVCAGVVYDCADIKNIHGIKMEEFPTHTGYHYASTAVEWYKLLKAMDEFDRTGIWVPEVSLQDGMHAVRMGLAATENLGWDQSDQPLPSDVA